MQRVKASDDLKQLNLLYVEDEEDIREPFLQLVGRYFKHIYVGSNGEEGLELFKLHKDKIDIIISDIRMPKKNGLDMAEEIKSIDYEIPIIFSTAFGDTEYLQKALNIGIDGYIIKPLDRNKLLLKLNYIAKSIVAKKKMQEYLHLIDKLINYQKAGVLLLDEHLNILIMNQSLKAIIENLGIKDYKVLDDLLPYCYDENGVHIDSKVILNNINKELICRGIKTNKYYEIHPQKVDNYYIINVDDITEYKQEEQKLQETVMIDELTKIYNRKKIESIKNELINESICVILFDIDNFKKINDTYGHLKGDEVLQTLAKTVKENVRSSDLFVRWGGEEFLIILRNISDTEMAYRLAEKLRIKINNIEVFEVGHFSCSFGVSCGIIKNPDDLKIIFDKADDLLYKAKREGKNRVVK